jgi:hypothetical protein
LVWAASRVKAVTDAATATFENSRRFIVPLLCGIIASLGLYILQ